MLLLEGGTSQDVATDIPAFGSTMKTENYIWPGVTVAQRNMGLGYNGAILGSAEGDVLGGSSTIGDLLYSRGHRSIYDRWANVYGATGWNFNTVLPYFLRSENNTSPQIVDGNPFYHSTTGPLKVSSIKNPDLILTKLQHQFNVMGIPTVDINGPTQLGTAMYQITADGVRYSSATAFLDPNPYPENLHILSNVFVGYVLFDGRRAIGVSYDQDGVKKSVNARREVIASLSTYGDAVLLMLSGVGPSDHLRSFNISVLADLPVGNNVQDHPAVTHYYEIVNNSLLNDPVGPTVQQLYQFYATNSGPLTENPHLVAYFSVPGNAEPQVPNGIISAQTMTLSSNLSELVLPFPSTMQNQWRQYFAPIAGKTVLALTSALMRPYSRGTMRLTSTDPKGYPLIDPNYLADQRDQMSLNKLTEMLFYLTQETEFAKYAKPVSMPVPGCEKFYCSEIPLYLCHDYVQCIVRQIGREGRHQVGTCRMGAVSRDDTVVDEKLRVKGVDRLRIIDVSIIPEIPNSETLAAAYMIGEYGAQMVIDDNRQ